MNRNESIYQAQPHPHNKRRPISIPIYSLKPNKPSPSIHPSIKSKPHPRRKKSNGPFTGPTQKVNLHSRHRHPTQLRRRLPSQSQWQNPYSISSSFRPRSDASWPLSLPLPLPLSLPWSIPYTWGFWYILSHSGRIIGVLANRVLIRDYSFSRLSKGDSHCRQVGGWVSWYTYGSR